MMRGRKNRFDQRAIDCARCVTISVERAGGSMALVRRGIHVATRVASDDVASDDVGPSRERPSGCRFLRRVHRSHRRHPARKAKPFWTACSSLHVTGLFSQTGTARRRRAGAHSPAGPGPCLLCRSKGPGRRGPALGGPRLGPRGLWAAARCEGVRRQRRRAAAGPFLLQGLDRGGGAPFTGRMEAGLLPARGPGGARGPGNFSTASRARASLCAWRLA